jgi:hypothetical protein
MCSRHVPVINIHIPIMSEKTDLLTVPKPGGLAPLAPPGSSGFLNVNPIPTGSATGTLTPIIYIFQGDLFIVKPININH